LTTLDTVIFDTPANRATSLIVTMPVTASQSADHPPIIRRDGRFPS
jgi:hypothetical protein